MILCTTTLLLLLNYGMSYAQYDRNYEEIRAQGEIPYDYLNLVRGNSRINIRNTEQLSKEDREGFRDATNAALRNIFISGDIYFNDALTDYVRLVGNQLLERNEAKGKVQFYVSKSTELNAASWQTGTIIINIGLLSRLENEAQLAYVLAHEIAHFNLQHPYKQYAQHLKKNQQSQSSELAKRFSEHLDYSLQYELEADSVALQSLSNYGYELDECINTLKILLNIAPRETFNLAQYLSSNTYQIEESQLCSFKQYNAFKKSSNYSNQHFSDKHIRKRLGRIAVLINRDYHALFAHKSDGRFRLAQSQFEGMNASAHFEVVLQSFLEANYLKSTFEAMVLMRKFPDNEFLHTQVAENLYFINHYNKLGLLSRIFFDNEKIVEDDYAKLCCLVNNFSSANLAQVVYGFIQKSYLDYQDNETMLITMAKATEEIKGMQSALPFYQNYVKLFPNGKHYLEAKRKLK